MDGIEPIACRTRKPRGQGASRRGEILQAAQRLFVEEGVQHVTMRRIASAVGVSATALYVYFPDKGAILEAIAAAYFTAFLAVLETAVQRGRPAPENLKAGCKAYVSLALAKPDEYRLTFMDDGRHTPDDPCKKLPEAESSIQILHDCVQGMIDEGYFPDTSPILMGEAIWSCMHGVVTLLLSMPHKLNADRDALTQQVLDMAIRGLCISPEKLPLLTEHR